MSKMIISQPFLLQSVKVHLRVPVKAEAGVAKWVWRVLVLSHSIARVNDLVDDGAVGTGNAGLGAQSDGVENLLPVEEGRISEECCQVRECAQLTGCSNFKQEKDAREGERNEYLCLRAATKYKTLKQRYINSNIKNQQQRKKQRQKQHQQQMEAKVRE